MKRIKKSRLTVLKKIRLRKILIVTNCIILTVCIVIVSLKLYDYYSNQKLYKSIANLYPVKDTATGGPLTDKPVDKDEIKPDSEPKISDKFQELLKTNDETVGWISIRGTNINYPVVQHADNEFYLDQNFKKGKSSIGAIFMDFRNKILPLDRNILLYGHHTKDQTMFTGLMSYKDKNFFLNNDKIVFNTLYQESEWQVFSVYVTDVKFDYLETEFENDEQFQKYIDSIKAKSKFKKDIPVGTNDHILTLSTCSYEFTAARTVVHARLIK